MLQFQEVLSIYKIEFPICELPLSENKNTENLTLKNF